jgi:hypothetical protein
MDILETHGHLISPEPNSGCWLWEGSCVEFGYGQLTLRQKRMLSHRLSWELSRGKIPDELFVLHKCDVPACVNPGHLFLGDNTDNMRDVRAKGRDRGLTKRKLTMAQAAYIRLSEKSGAELALEFEVSRKAIWHVRKNISYKEERS